jgi:glycosyltransferase involved in cell wall biosynthesis
MQLAERNPLRRIGYFAKRRFLRRRELSYAPRFDRVLVVSEHERQVLRTALPRLTVSVIPNGVDTRRLRPFPPSEEGPRLLFVGNLAYRPNVQAALELCTTILPLIRRQAPEVRLEIVGPDPPRSLLRAARSRAVEVRGSLSDLEPSYRRATVSVVPLRAAGGTRLKILESMAYGRPVVSTTVGCEGLAFTGGRELLVADEPADFADKTLSLLGDEGMREALAARARKAVEESYDWDAIAERLLALYARLATRT